MNVRSDSGIIPHPDWRCPVRKSGPFLPAVALVSIVLMFLLAAAAPPAQAQGELLVAKDTLMIKAPVEEITCRSDDRSCVPGNLLKLEVSFEAIGALPSGGQFWVEYAPAGKKPLNHACATREVFQKPDRVGADCGWRVRELEAERGIHYRGAIPAGLVPFTIGLRNELMATDTVLYKGKFKVGSYKFGTTLAYYVDEDWRLPIGYLYFTGDRGLRVVTWYRGRPGGIRAFLFYNGKEIAKNEGCGIGSEAEFDPHRWDWWIDDCEFVGVYRTDPGEGQGYDPRFIMGQNPGDYEVKAIVGGKLARSVKFTVREDGTIDNSIAESNKVGTDRILVPVRVITDPVPWNRQAWKTEAYYGNPLTGFAPPTQ